MVRPKDYIGLQHYWHYHPPLLPSSYMNLFTAIHTKFNQPLWAMKNLTRPYSGKGGDKQAVCVYPVSCLITLHPSNMEGYFLSCMLHWFNG